MARGYVRVVAPMTGLLTPLGPVCFSSGRATDMAAFEREHPQVAAALNRLAGRISAEEMSEINYRVKAQGEAPEQVARDYLRSQGLLRE